MYYSPIGGTLIGNGTTFVVVLFIHRWETKGTHTFPKGICMKVNVIARLELELAFYDSAV